MERERHAFYRYARGTEGDRGAAVASDHVVALDSRTTALVRVSALLAIGAPAPLCEKAIGRALEVGASREDVVATLMTISRIVGLARVVSAAPTVAVGIGYDIDAALER